MRKTVKAISSLLLTMLLVIGSVVTVFAADATITYTGKDHLFDFAQGSEYTETDLFNNFKNVMPGDVLIQKITVTNEASDCDYINLYMRARVHDEENNPLSTAVAANGENVTSMSDFLGQLTMRIYNGKTLIYEASPDELDGLQENVLLGSFRKGESIILTVELEVPITLGNEYAYRVGEVDWVFRIEAMDDFEPDEPESDDSELDDSEPDDSKPDDPQAPETSDVQSPKTGDTSSLLPYIILAGIGILVLICLVVFRRRKDSEDN